MKNPLMFAICIVIAFYTMSTQANVWQPSPGHTQVPIWPSASPDDQPVVG